MRKIFLIITFLFFLLIIKAQSTISNPSKNIICSDTIQIKFIWSFPEIIEKGYITRKGFLVTTDIVVDGKTAELVEIYTTSWSSVDIKRVKKIFIETWDY